MGNGSRAGGQPTNKHRMAGTLPSSLSWLPVLSGTLILQENAYNFGVITNQ